MSSDHAMIDSQRDDSSPGFVMGDRVDEASATRWATDELVRLIGIPSRSGEEHEIVRYLEGRARDLGLPARTQSVDGAGPNLVISWCERPQLLITAHVDTVVPTWEWSGRATVAGTSVYGLGAQDDKGCVVACLLGMLLAGSEGVDLASTGVAVGLCSDEEVGGRGSRTMARELRPEYVVALEGTGMDIALAEAGYLDVDVDVHGNSVHGSLREQGDNAVVKAARMIVELGDTPLGPHRHPFLGAGLANVEEFRGGSTLNVVPENATFRLSLRLLPGVSPDEAVARVEQVARRFDAGLTILGRAEGYETPPDAALPQALASAVCDVLGEAPGFTGMPAVTDGHSFVELAGSETVVFGPGHLENAHIENEHIDIRDVIDCARVLARLIASAQTVYRHTVPSG